MICMERSSVNLPIFATHTSSDAGGTGWGEPCAPDPQLVAAVLAYYDTWVDSWNDALACKPPLISPHTFMGQPAGSWNASGVPTDVGTALNVVG
jgi:hypothetical protein